jgi:hypothetical protein
MNAPEAVFVTLATDPDGRVVSFINIRSAQAGAVSTMPPWDYVLIARGVLSLASVVGKRIVAKVLARAAGKVAAKVAGAIGSGLADEVAVTIRSEIQTVTAQDMVRWEEQGGHTLLNHNPLLTRTQLAQRLPGGSSAESLYTNIWRGNKAQTSSKWISEKVMNDTIGNAVNQNINGINEAMRAGTDFRLENYVVGRQLGEGWVQAGVKAVDPKAGGKEIAAVVGKTIAPGEIGALWRPDLTAMTMIIRPRPTPDNPLGWFVLTAFPDVP